jgi:hypothetical protein
MPFNDSQLQARTPERISESLLQISIMHNDPTSGRSTTAAAVCFLAQMAANADFWIPKEKYERLDGIIQEGIRCEGHRLLNRTPDNTSQTGYNYAALLQFVRIHAAAHLARVSAFTTNYEYATWYYIRCFQIIASADDLYKQRGSGWNFNRPSPAVQTLAIAIVKVAQGKFEDAATIFDGLSIFELSLRLKTIPYKVACYRALAKADEKDEAKRSTWRRKELEALQIGHHFATSARPGLSTENDIDDPWLFWDNHPATRNSIVHC